MTTIKRFSSTLALTLFALALTAHAQTPPIEVSTDDEAAEFSAQGGMNKVHVEVYAPSGELVFETDASSGQSIRWPGQRPGLRRQHRVPVRRPPQAGRD